MAVKRNYSLLKERERLHEVNLLKQRVAELEAALRAIEMETRRGGQWGIADVNEAARTALSNDHG